MKIIDPTTLENFQGEADSVLQALATKHGLKGSRCRVRYNDADFTLKTVFSLLENENGENPAKRRWNNLCGTYGLKKTWFGKSFTCSQGTFKIIGIDAKKRKNVVACLKKGTNEEWNFNAKYCRNEMQ